MKRMPMLSARLFGTPLAIEPHKFEVILAAIGPRVLGELEMEISRVENAANPTALLPARGVKPTQDSLAQIVDGVAMIDVSGTLVHRSSWMDAVSGLASYEKLSDEMDRAVADPNVRAVLLCINSPGGEVAGMFEMAERIQALRGKGKAIHAIASDSACSAAFLLGAACEKFYATEAAVTGSIGIVWAHVDVSEADKKAGIKVTHIHAGARKVDGNAHEPLTGEALNTLQAHVDKTAAVFFARVDKYRGLAAGTAKATEAAVFIGSEAAKAGLIDGIKSTRQVLAELKSGQRSLPLNGGTSATAKGSTMDLEQALAALAASKQELEAKGATIATLTAANTKLEARIEALTLSQREAIVDKHIRAGIAPAMRGSAMKLAATCTLEELDAEMATWPKASRPNPTGKVDAAPPEEAEKGADPLVLLNEKAAAIQAANPGMTQPDAFSKACFANPTLYAAHRAATTIRKKGA